jgi:hypothetical protein
LSAAEKPRWNTEDTGGYDRGAEGFDRDSGLEKGVAQGGLWEAEGEDAGGAGKED